VDRQLANVSMKRQPGICADQFGRLVAQDHSQRAPDVDRAKFETLPTKMDGSAGHFPATQTALGPATSLPIRRRWRRRSDGWATPTRPLRGNGMPPPRTCPHHDSTTSRPAPSPSTPAPAEAWQQRHASLQALQQASAPVLAGRIWVAGGLTKPTTATGSTQIYIPTSDAWKPDPSLPEAMDHAMLVTYQNRAKP